MANKAFELQANGHHENLEKISDNASQNKVMGSNTDDKITNAVNSAVSAVKKCRRDAISIKTGNVLILRVEMALRSIRDSSRNGPSSVVQNPEGRDFTGRTENTPLRSASSRLDLIFEIDEIHETLRLVILIMPRTVTSRRQDLFMTGERTLIQKFHGNDKPNLVANVFVTP